MNLSKALTQLILCSSLLLINPLFARTLSTAEAINQSGQQRMLSQRIAKNYILITHQISAKDAAIELDESVAKFEENLLNLRDTISHADSLEKLQALSKEWQQFRTFVLSQQNKNQSQQVLQLNTELLNRADDLVKSIESNAGRKHIELVNISGKQRMLSQRIALYYMASASGYRDAATHAIFEQSVSAFQQGLVQLQKHPGNSDEIKQALDEVTKQWDFYQYKFDGIGEQAYVPRVIRVITEGFLNDMDKITSLYEKEFMNDSANTMN